MGVPKNARAAPLAAATKERGRLVAAQADIAEQKAAKMRGEWCAPPMSKANGRRSCGRARWNARGAVAVRGAVAAFEQARRCRDRRGD
jgi:hypothetical protein